MHISSEQLGPLTIAQAKKYLPEVHHETIRRWCFEGKLMGAIRIGRRWLIPRATLAAISGVPIASQVR